MPLHLLGKKSWNVYNQDNIARVQKDEAEAKAKEAENERKRQDVDSDRRLQLLRGEVADVVADASTSHEGRRKRAKYDHGHAEVEDLRNNRRRSAHNVAQHSQLDSSATFEQAHDDNGKRKRPQENDQMVGMRLADATGYGNRDTKPWYSSTAKELRAGEYEVSKDVWGNEDPRRAMREKKRLDTNDPLAAMKRGVKQLRQAEVERAEWKAQRERDLDEVENLAAHHQSSHSHSQRWRRRSNAESLEDFNLDEGYGRHDRDEAGEQRDYHHRRHRSHHHHHRSRRDDRGRDRHRSRSPRRSSKS